MKNSPILLKLLVPLLIIILGAFIIKQLMTTAPQAQTQKPATSGLLVQTTTLQPKAHTLTLSTVGSIEASQKGVLSSKVSGKITAISPELTPGTFVRKGTLLAQIDPTDYEASIAQLEAQLSSAKAALMIEEGQQASAKKELALSNIEPVGLSRSLLLREPQLIQAKASIASLEASLKTAKNNLKECHITAPFDGIITQKKAELGNYISAQNTLVEMVASDTYWLTATLPSQAATFLNNLSHDELKRLSVRLRKSDTPLHVKASITKLLPELDTTTKQPKILITIEDPLGLKVHKNAKTPSLLLGETLTIDMALKHFENVMVVPIKLLRANDTLWVMNESQKLHIKPITVLAKEKEFALVQEGILPTDKIITTYLTTAVEGMALQEITEAKGKGKQ